MDELISVLAHELEIGDITADRRWFVKSLRTTIGSVTVTWDKKDGQLLSDEQQEFTYSARTRLNVFRELDVTEEQLSEMRNGLEIWLK